MKKRYASVLLLIVMLCMTSPAFAAKNSKNDASSTLITIGVLFVAGVIGVILWAGHTPASVKEYQRKEKAKQQERENAVSDAATSRLGVVILRYELGHYQTSYFNGVSNTYFVNGGGPDSAGGYTAIIEVVNSCGKTAKYFKFHTRLLNYVGDPAPCEIGKPDNILEATGPLSHGSTYAWEWKNFVYSRNVGKMVLDSVTVDYMDGTSEEFSGDQIVWRLSKIN